MFSFVAFRLAPHFANFHKRIVKTPKVYFYDTGLLCYLLRITNTDQLFSHPLRGAIFENWIVTERMKFFFNRGEEAPLYFWRDGKGHEVDLITDRGEILEPAEIKSAATFDPSFADGLTYFAKLQKKPGGVIYYGGEESFAFKEYSVRGWREV